MNIYEQLGVRRVINAKATITSLGGSLMPREVLDAMADAATAFVDIADLQRKIGERIALMTHNDGAYVSSGAAAGLTLAAAACATGTDLAKVDQVPDLTGMRNEIAIHTSQRFVFDRAFRLAGFTLREFGFAHVATEWQLEAALSEHTAAIAYIVAPHLTGRGFLPLEVVVKIAASYRIPVIVDAAAQLPPPSNLWRFTKDMGADLAIFSGGKDLRGPQGTGLIVGRKDLIDAIALNGNPHVAVGRPMKVGKEELVGVYAAVKRYLSLDHEAIGRLYEERVATIIRGLQDMPGVTTTRDYPNEAGQPAPRVLVRLAPPLSRDAVVAALRQGDPAIEVYVAGPDGILLNPMTLEEGEELMVIQRLREAVPAIAAAR